MLPEIVDQKNNLKTPRMSEDIKHTYVKRIDLNKIMSLNPATTQNSPIKTNSNILIQS